MMKKENAVQKKHKWMDEVVMQEGVIKEKSAFMEGGHS